MALKILLDSHAFVWFVLGDRRCSARARDAIEAAAGNTRLSAVTAWEIATKVRIGKWPEAEAISGRMPEVIEAFELTLLPISIHHGHLAGSLPGPHKDPFDRILAAQADIENLLLITADQAFASFGTRTLW